MLVTQETEIMYWFFKKILKYIQTTWGQLFGVGFWKLLFEDLKKKPGNSLLLFFLRKQYSITISYSINSFFSADECSLALNDILWGKGIHISSYSYFMIWNCALVFLMPLILETRKSHKHFNTLMASSNMEPACLYNL
jgi:hypothetical protein